MSLKPTCPSCGKARFEIRIFKDDGVGSATCLKCARDYMILDSEDHWFDIIQRGYPRVRRCSCKATSVTLKIDYGIRDDGEVDSVALWSTCSSCKKTTKQFAADIDYGGTESLITQPLTYCKTPKVLYDLRELTLYVRRQDIAKLVQFLADRGCLLTAWLREESQWVMRDVDTKTAIRAVLYAGEHPSKNDLYLRMYGSLARPDTGAVNLDSLKEEASFWKREEVIRISSPTQVIFGDETGLLYYLQFANELVEDGRAVPKSDPFRALTEDLLAWLKTNFVSWRGPLTFDTPAENVRLFGDRFRAKSEKR